MKTSLKFNPINQKLWLTKRTQALLLKMSSVGTVSVKSLSKEEKTLWLLEEYGLAKSINGKRYYLTVFGKAVVMEMMDQSSTTHTVEINHLP